MPPKKGRSLTEDKRFVAVVDQQAQGHETIGDMVYAVLHEAISSGALAPGEWLRQESLAEAIGVSRIPVRTALLLLESEGLVTFHPHRGARVRTLSPAQISEIYRVRTLLETHAIRLSMVRMSAKRLARIRELGRQLDDEHAGPDFLRIRIEFYRESYDAENNPLLVQMIEELRSHVGRHFLHMRLNENHATHLELVEFIERGDLVAAESWLRVHLQHVRDGLLELAAKTDRGGSPTDEPDKAVKLSSQVAGPAGSRRPVPVIKRTKAPVVPTNRRR
jgi:DNA-binding GntR family transcriptional regulator